MWECVCKERWGVSVSNILRHSHIFVKQERFTFSMTTLHLPYRWIYLNYCNIFLSRSIFCRKREGFFFGFSSALFLVGFSVTFPWCIKSHRLVTPFRPKGDWGEVRNIILQPFLATYKIHWMSNMTKIRIEACLGRLCDTLLLHKQALVWV